MRPKSVAKSKAYGPPFFCYLGEMGHDAPWKASEIDATGSELVPRLDAKRRNGCLLGRASGSTRLLVVDRHAEYLPQNAQ
jgi:hypothetical protein